MGSGTVLAMVCFDRRDFCAKEEIRQEFKNSRLIFFFLMWWFFVLFTLCLVIDLTKIDCREKAHLCGHEHDPLAKYFPLLCSCSFFHEYNVGRPYN